MYVHCMQNSDLCQILPALYETVVKSLEEEEKMFFTLLSALICVMGRIMSEASCAILHNLNQMMNKNYWAAHKSSYNQFSDCLGAQFNFYHQAPTDIS